MPLTDKQLAGLRARAAKTRTNPGSKYGAHLDRVADAIDRIRRYAPEYDPAGSSSDGGVGPESAGALISCGLLEILAEAVEEKYAPAIADVEAASRRCDWHMDRADELNHELVTTCSLAQLKKAHAANPDALTIPTHGWHVGSGAANRGNNHAT